MNFLMLANIIYKVKLQFKFNLVSNSPDSEDELEKEYTDLSNLPIDLVSEEYPYEKTNDYSHTWNQFLANNKRTKFSS